VGHESDPSNQTNGIQFWGNSFACGPQGELIAKANNTDEQILIVEIDQSRTESVRRIWPFFRDRRIDAFSNLTKRYL
jgi:N-carbamoylputrescine amidase